MVMHIFLSKITPRFVFINSFIWLYNQFLSLWIYEPTACFILNSKILNTAKTKWPTQPKNEHKWRNSLKNWTFTLNLNGPTGGLAYGTPKNDLIDRPLCDRSVRPTNLLPFGNVTFNSSDVLATINKVKLLKIKTNAKTAIFVFILST